MKLNKSLWKNQQIVCITFDVDWASEDALAYTYNIIENFGFSSTFFLTHESKLLLYKIKNKNINSGIHPNFLPGSSHGKTPTEIIDYCTKLLPEAISFRSHKYFDNNDIVELLQGKGFKYDSNLCTNLEIVDPFIHRSGLIRFPIYFEDGAYLLHGNNLNFAKVKNELFNKPGLMVFNFHPMHIVINTPTFNYMRSIKNTISNKIWNNLTNKEIEHLSYNGRGIRNFMFELFHYIKKENLLVFNLEEVYNIVIKND